jgi:hypothetical protein
VDRGEIEERKKESNIEIEREGDSEMAQRQA